MHGSSFATPAFRPVGFDFCGLVGILESLVPALHGSICSRSVRVEHMVLWLDFNGLAKLVTVNPTVRCGAPAALMVSLT